MRQILQNLGSGETMLVDVTLPSSPSRGLFIRSSSSLASLGAERMLIVFGKAQSLAKARVQLEMVKQVIQKVKANAFAALPRRFAPNWIRPFSWGTAAPYVSWASEPRGAPRMSQWLRIPDNVLSKFFASPFSVPTMGMAGLAQVRGNISFHGRSDGHMMSNTSIGCRLV